MKSYPTFRHVCDDIGEKSVEAFALAVLRTRDDLRVYRSTFAQWVADHSERGLANWISDRLWARLSALAESVPDMTVYEKGPIREVIIGWNYRFRFKRHDDEGAVASYPTAGFLDFVEQPTAQLPGLEETRLIAGYDWHKDLRAMGAAVMSLRDGKDNIIWKEPLPEVFGQSGAVSPERPGPTRPSLNIPENIGQKPRETTEDE